MRRNEAHEEWDERRGLGLEHVIYETISSRKPRDLSTLKLIH